MEQLVYSSTAAFLAHYRTLSNAATDRGGVPSLSTREHEILNAMHHVMEALTPEERGSLVADAANGDQKSSEQRRRRQRVQLKLRRILRSKGVVRD